MTGCARRVPRLCQFGAGKKPHCGAGGPGRSAAGTVQTYGGASRRATGTAGAARAQNGQMTDEVTVLVAVCSPPVREALVAMIGAQARFRIVAEACTHEEAVQLARLTRPLVALVDAGLRGYGGVWAGRSLLGAQRVV